eukprot:15345853-Ditylum_brightwellii.AAC.1
MYRNHEKLVHRTSPYSAFHCIEYPPLPPLWGVLNTLNIPPYVAGFWPSSGAPFPHPSPTKSCVAQEGA